MSLVIKKHINKGKLLLAIADKDLLGKIYTEGKKQLDLKSNFYKGEKKTNQEIISLIKGSYIVNAVGEKTISFLEKTGFISTKETLKINNIPYVQVVIINK